MNNINDKENRRITPIRTMEVENQKRPTEKVRENAGKDNETVEKETNMYRANEEKGINPQSLDGIEVENTSGKTLNEVKSNIVEEALEKGDMSHLELDEFVEQKIRESGLELTDAEIQKTKEEIEEQIIDESRFPRREPPRM